MRTKVKTKRTTVKMPLPLLEQIQDMADRKGQSVNTIVVAIVWEAAFGARFTAVK